MDDLTPFFVIVGLVLVACAVGAIRPLLRRRRRARLRSRPCLPAHEAIIERNVPLYARLPAPLKDELKGYINVFLAEKRFEGCGGLEITDEIRVTIAAQACMLLLGRKTDYYPRLISILVYPAAYVARGGARVGEHWVEGSDVRAGESWPNGTVVLTWDHVRHGAGDLADGHNVVLHEFAHQLDQENGSADGVPVLDGRSSYLAWGRIVGREYQQLRRDVERNRPALLDDYGATHPAEFFAVATETFFEKPHLLQRKEPELYDELKNYYHLDPAAWKQDASTPADAS